MRYLLEYNDPELDSLFSDFLDLGISKDRVMIKITIEGERLMDIHFPRLDRVGKISFSDILNEIQNNKIEYEEAENSPTISKPSIVVVKQNFVEAVGDVIGLKVMDDKVKVFNIIRKTSKRFYIDDIRVDLYIDGALTFSEESEGFEF